MCVLLASCIRPAWRNAIAHEQVWWDSGLQQAMLAGEAVEPRILADAALRAHEICAGFEAGIAVALNQAGNPHERGAATENEIARDIYALLALGESGITVSGLHREGATLRLRVNPLTIETMPSLLGALISATAHAPEVKVWEIRQTRDRPPLRISTEAIQAALTCSEAGGAGHRVIEMPTAGLPLIFSGLLNHDPASPFIIPSLIALAASGIVGERGRLAPRLAASDEQAFAELSRTMERTARAVEAAATLAAPGERPMLRAFARLVLGVRRQVSGAEPSAAAQGIHAIEVAFRSSAPARLPWLNDKSGA